jgi:hypothetical protein
MVRPNAYTSILGAALALCTLGDGLAHAQCPTPPANVAEANPPAGVPQAPLRPNPFVPREAVAAAGATRGYCIYKPPALTSLSDTMIVYIHGAQTAEDGGLDAMLQTLASLGYFVVYPDVAPITSNFFFTTFPNWQQQTRMVMTAALQRLANQGTPITNLVVSGFSLGAMAAARVAAAWTGPPAIDALVLHDPAGQSFIVGPNQQGGNQFEVKASDLASVPSSIFLLINQSAQVVSDPNSSALLIWNNLPQIPRFTQRNGQTVPQRNFLRMRNDSSHGNATGNRLSLHGSIAALPPPFATNPFFSITQFTSIDSFGYIFPLFGTAFEAVFGSNFLGYSALCNERSTTGNCALTRNMGTWADGIPATPMRNAGDLCLFNEPGCVPLQ